jgi:predicted anti-sigma-YlaC factor YlaD
MAELVTDYLEGSLSLPRRVSARVHLLCCEACRHYFDQMRKTVRLLAISRSATPDPAVLDRLATEARRHSTEGPGP